MRQPETQRTTRANLFACEFDRVWNKTLRVMVEELPRGVELQGWGDDTSFSSKFLAAQGFFYPSERGLTRGSTANLCVA